MADHPGLKSADLRKLFLGVRRNEPVGELNIELISGGRSNLTYVVNDDVQRWVARRPPLACVTPSAHDMEREWAVTSALVDTAVPVAKPVVIVRPDR